MPPQEKIKKILFVTLSNIGDCILTLPCLDILREKYPQAVIDVIAGPRPEELFNNNPFINKVIIYNKHTSLKEKIGLIIDLRRQKYDLIIDLRNSIFQLLVNAKYKTTPFMHIPKNVLHMKDRHLSRLAKIIDIKTLHSADKTIRTSLKDKAYIENILKENNLINSRFITVAPGARSHTKRWMQDSFTKTCDRLIQAFNVKIVLVGDEADKKINAEIVNSAKYPLLDFSGKLSLLQLSELLKYTLLVISNDSAVMHLASYLDIPVAAIFGITDSRRYGPWSKKSIIVQKRLNCSPCQKAQCKFHTLQCMKDISVEDVFDAAAKQI